MTIQELVKEFVVLVLERENELKDLSALIIALDKLACSLNDVSYEFDETDYPEVPENDYQVIRKIVEKRFPTLGYYNTSRDVSEHLETSEIIIGDAVDDISDIVGDLLDVLWCFENTSKNDALWHFENSFRSHWGRHLRELQLYLHDKQW